METAISRPGCRNKAMLNLICRVSFYFVKTSETLQYLEFMSLFLFLPSNISLPKWIIKPVFKSDLDGQTLRDRTAVLPLDQDFLDCFMYLHTYKNGCIAVITTLKFPLLISYCFFELNPVICKNNMEIAEDCT